MFTTPYTTHGPKYQIKRQSLGEHICMGAEAPIPQFPTFELALIARQVQIKVGF
jgi:hypothetical protein